MLQINPRDRPAAGDVYQRLYSIAEAMNQFEQQNVPDLSGLRIVADDKQDQHNSIFAGYMASPSRKPVPLRAPLNGARTHTEPSLSTENTFHTFGNEHPLPEDQRPPIAHPQSAPNVSLRNTLNPSSAYLRTPRSALSAALSFANLREPAIRSQQEAPQIVESSIVAPLTTSGSSREYYMDTEYQALKHRTNSQWSDPLQSQSEESGNRTRSSTVTAREQSSPSTLSPPSRAVTNFQSPGLQATGSHLSQDSFPDLNRIFSIKVVPDHADFKSAGKMSRCQLSTTGDRIAFLTKRFAAVCSIDFEPQMWSERKPVEDKRKPWTFSLSPDWEIVSVRMSDRWLGFHVRGNHQRRQLPSQVIHLFSGLGVEISKESQDLGGNMLKGLLDVSIAADSVSLHFDNRTVSIGETTRDLETYKPLQNCFSQSNSGVESVAIGDNLLWAFDWSNGRETWKAWDHTLPHLPLFCQPRWRDVRNAEASGDRSRFLVPFGDSLLVCYKELNQVMLILEDGTSQEISVGKRIEAVAASSKFNIVVLAVAAMHSFSKDKLLVSYLETRSNGKRVLSAPEPLCKLKERFHADSCSLAITGRVQGGVYAVVAHPDGLLEKIQLREMG
jgi:hypothetical protein